MYNVDRESVSDLLLAYTLEEEIYLYGKLTEEFVSYICGEVEV